MKFHLAKWQRMLSNIQYAKLQDTACMTAIGSCANEILIVERVKKQ